MPEKSALEMLQEFKLRPAPGLRQTWCSDWPEARLVVSGMSPEHAARFHAGQLPGEIKHWPAAPRYRVVELERGKMQTEAAVAKVREEWACG